MSEGGIWLDSAFRDEIVEWVCERTARRVTRGIGHYRKLEWPLFSKRRNWTAWSLLNLIHLNLLLLRIRLKDTCRNVEANWGRRRIRREICSGSDRRSKGLALDCFNRIIWWNSDGNWLGLARSGLSRRNSARRSQDHVLRCLTGLSSSSTPRLSLHGLLRSDCRRWYRWVFDSIIGHCTTHRRGYGSSSESVATGRGRSGQYGIVQLGRGHCRKGDERGQEGGGMIGWGRSFRWASRYSTADWREQPYFPLESLC